MNRSILIKLVVVLLVAVLVHSVFWFFKTGQLEKHINNFVAENNSAVSMGEMKVVGYPLKQKVIVKDLRFTIPNPAFSKYQISIKSLEASSSIFSFNFIANIMDKVTLQDSEGNVANVEFNQNPQISFSIADGIVSKFNYSDNGYRVFDIDKKIIYTATTSSINIDSSIDDNDQITSKLLVSAKEIEGFDVLDVYRNSSEKRIIDGIKTGEISIGGGVVAAMVSADAASMDPFTDEVVAPVAVGAAASAVIVSDANKVAKNSANASAKVVAIDATMTAKKAPAAASAAVAPAVVAAPATVATAPAQAPAVATAPAPALGTPPSQAKAPTPALAALPTPTKAPVVGAVAPALPDDGAKTAAMAVSNDVVDPALALSPEVVANEDVKPVVDIAAIIAENNIIKSDLLIDITYVLTPTKNEQQPAIPLDPMQLQELVVQYSRAVKINKIELSNPLYKISIDGQVNYFQDDNLPSGFITVQVENITNFTNYIQDGFNKISDQTQAMPDVQMSDLSTPMQFQSATYPDFLKKVASGIYPVAKELAEKNQLSKEETAVFDMRREKNLEFVINETPLREVLGKF